MVEMHADRAQVERLEAAERRRMLEDFWTSDIFEWIQEKQEQEGFIVLGKKGGLFLRTRKKKDPS